MSSLDIDGTRLMALVEQRQDLVARLPLRHVAADRDDCAGAVGACDNGQVQREGVLPLGDDQVAVVDRRALEPDEDIIVAGLGDGSLLVDEGLEALAGALDEPLLLGRGESHCERAVAGDVTILECFGNE